MSQVQDITLNPPSQGLGSRVVIVAAGQGSIGPITAAQVGYMTLYVDALVFMCRGAVGTVAVVDVDQILVAGSQYRVGPLAVGEYLKFTSTPGGNVWWTPGS